MNSGNRRRQIGAPRAIVLGLALAMMSGSLKAQTSSGQMVVTVQDPQGAAVAGVARFVSDAGFASAGVDRRVASIKR